MTNRTEKTINCRNYCDKNVHVFHSGWSAAVICLLNLLWFSNRLLDLVPSIVVSLIDFWVAEQMKSVKSRDVVGHAVSVLAGLGLKTESVSLRKQRNSNNHFDKSQLNLPACFETKSLNIEANWSNIFRYFKMFPPQRHWASVDRSERSWVHA